MSGGACVAALALGLSAPATASAADNPTVAAGDQMAGPPPSAAHVWMSGHWNFEGGQWKWAAGHWDLPPNRSAVWVPGHWIQGSSGWVWVNGAWNVAEAPQSPSAPPQPPGSNQAPAQGGQAVPMPSTPAPEVAGQYGPEGQAPVTYQAPAENYYPATDYSVVYPGYYWDGAAWAWGIYPAFGIGLGWWGPGYWGWGHGGWGYYGHGYGYGHGYRGGSFGHAAVGHFGGGHTH
jgi:hypothetical protein